MDCFFLLCGLSLVSAFTMIYAPGTDLYYTYTPAYGYTYDQGNTWNGRGGLFQTILIVFVFVFVMQFLFGSGSENSKGSSYSSYGSYDSVYK